MTLLIIYETKLIPIKLFNNLTSLIIIEKCYEHALIHAFDRMFFYFLKYI